MDFTRADTVFPADTEAARVALDTSNCETEPIRYPGTVQPHGVLLVLAAAGNRIEAASQSCQALLGRPASSLLGQRIGELFGPQIEAALLAEPVDGLQPWLPLLLDGQPFWLRRSFNAAGQNLLDIEPEALSVQAVAALRHQYRRGLETLRRLDRIDDIAQAAAVLVRAMTGLEQVMIYRFDAAWNGAVIAEARADWVESYLGQNFPASDIPAQARELFQLCRVRQIPDVNYTPAALLASSNASAIDLGPSSLRSISAIHIEYLHNMGARATLSGALVVEGRLWGLLSCQQKSGPHYLCPTAREVIGYLCEDLAELIEARQIRQRYAHDRSLAKRRQQLMTAVRSFEFRQLMRPENNADLLGVVGADGFAMLVGGSIQTTGSTPDKARILQLQQQRLARAPAQTLFASNALNHDLAIADGADGVAGALFLSVLRQPLVTMIWFRRERHFALSWSGNPQQPHSVASDGRLTPRKSFDRFLQNVRGQSLAWTAEELNSATELAALVEIEALREREAFSQTVLNSMTELISVLDTQGVIVSVNESWKHFAAANDAPELVNGSVGISYREICSAAAGQPDGEQAQAAWTGIEAVLKQQVDAFEIDYQCDSPQQSRWFRMSVYPLQAPGAGALVMHEDITQRKRLELKIQASERRFHKLLHHNHAVILQIDPASGLILDANDAACKFYGWSHDALCAMRIEQINQSNAAQVTAERELARTEQRNYFIFPHRLASGETRIVEVHSTPIDTGARTELVSIIHDVTDRVNGEQRIEQLLREQKAILENDLVGIMQASQRKIIWANPAFEKILGYEAGELVGKETRLGYTSEQAYLDFGAAAYPLITSGQVFRSQIEYVRKDGRHIWVDVSGTMLDKTAATSLWFFVEITEQKHVVDLLRESESRFRSMADSAPVLIWIAGLDKLCFWFNQFWLDFTGRSMAQEQGNGWTEGVHPADLDRCMQTYASAFDARQRFAMEYRLRRFDGQYRWLIDTGVPRFDERGNFSGYIGSCIDITQRKQTEEALQTSQQRLNLAQQGANLGIWELDLISGAAYWSPECERLYGLKPGTLKHGDEWRALVHVDDLPLIDAQWAERIDRQLPFEVEYRLGQDSASVRWLLSKGRAIYDATGRAVELIGINIDVTERRRLQGLLEEKMQLLDTVLDNSSVGITFVRDRKQIWCNRRMAEMHGYAPAEMVNQDTRMFYASQAAYDEVEQQGYATLARGERFSTELEMRRKDGSICWMRLSGKAIDAREMPLGSIWVFENISQQKRTEVELTKAKEAAEAANIAKSRFLATMSHEIRTPMNGILGMAQLLLTPNLNDDDRQNYTHTVLESGQTLLRLLDDILDISKVESGRLELELTAFEAAQIITDTQSLFAEAASHRGLRLESDTSAVNGQLYQGDPHRLRQMLANLVSNAIKFTHSGQIRIELREHQRDDTGALLEFSVADSGIGIAPDKQSMLFQPFSQLDSSTTRQYGGTGLGLSIVQALARLMGGEVGVDSQLGQGSRFWFRIHAGLLTDAQQPFPATAAGQRPNRLIPATRLSGHVLAVEDDSINRLVIAALLKTLGLDVAFAENGQQALDWLVSGEAADLILMDIQMPVMDGYAATTLIRQWEIDNGRARHPIIALSANVFEEDRLRCLTVGMDDFIGKPIVSVAALRSVLERWLPKAATTSLARSLPLPAAVAAADPVRVLAILRELAPLLAQNSFGAVARFKDLQLAVVGTELAVEVAAVKSLIDEFRFEDALQRLQQMIAAHGWEDNPDHE